MQNKTIFEYQVKVIKIMIYTFFLYFAGSESPTGYDSGSLNAVAGCKDGAGTGKGQPDTEGDRYRRMSKLLIGGNKLEDTPHLSNEISAPYEVPQYPIEQIETKLNRYFVSTDTHTHTHIYSY